MLTSLTVFWIPVNLNVSVVVQKNVLLNSFN